ncbi:hypothetical protein [Methanimicrococcus stummii]|uniref:hypothetical protein n=1 Tax=Methanimicrococcus stummii TaxID=3028294 RepID=UPI002930357C|nr:hypothetical protein [Methanimicrococcus sp. Es2]
MHLLLLITSVRFANVGTAALPFLFTVATSPFPFVAAVTAAGAAAARRARAAQLFKK